MSMSVKVKQKQSLSLSLKTWLPLLQAPLQELDTMFRDYSYENPFLKVKSHFELNSFYVQDSTERDFIENVSFNKESLYDKINMQICKPMFPTPISQQVAREILSNIDSEGYFDIDDLDDIAQQCNVTKEFVESIRQRFKYIEPIGVASIDITESFLFQLERLDIDEELYDITSKIIHNLKNIDKYHKHNRFEESKEILKKFHNPPLVEYISEENYIIPDFFVEVDDKINLKINNSYYPDIEIDSSFKTKDSDIKDKLKEARDLVNLLELRKSTLYKLILVIIEKQTGFFIGSELKPLTMLDVANELGFEESTISRAVSNKYIKCSQGTFPLKHFFTNAVSKNLSSSEIKNFILRLVDNEDQQTPMKDQDIVDVIMQRYQLKIVRRTITKYRKLLNIPSSKERKKIYLVQNS
jgi:RNA polymerase sigma-54 factor